MKIKQIILTLLLLNFAVKIKAQEEGNVMQTPTGDIYGTIMLPETKLTVPVVLLIAGSGPTDMNGNQNGEGSNNLKMIADKCAISYPTVNTHISTFMKNYMYKTAPKPSI